MKSFIVIICSLLVLFCLCIFSLTFFLTPVSTVEKSVVQPTAIPVTVTPVPTPIDSNLKQEIESSYMEGCDYDGKQTEYCQCTFDYLYVKLGLDTSRYLTYTNEAASECLYLYKF